MNRLIEETMKRAVLIGTMIVLLLAWGGLAAWQIQRDYLPEINNPTLTIAVRAEKFQAGQVKLRVTQPIQQAVRVVDGLQDVETSSFTGGALIRLNFPMKYDMARAEEQVTNALNGISLPSGVAKPQVTRLSTHSLPIMRISLISSSAAISENTLRTSIQEDVVNRIKSIPGVQDVRVTGGGSAGYAINIRTADLVKAGLTIEDIKRSLKENHTTEIEGMVSNNQSSLPIQVSGWSINQQDLLQLPLHTRDGKTIPLSTVADISNSVVNLQTVSRTDGKPSVLLDILKTPTSNITDVASRIESKLNEIPALKNKDLQLSVLFNQGEQVNDALKGLVKEGLLGSFFAMISVFVFFRKVRSTVVIAISLPICLLATTGILNTMGISLNILTISGLIVAMGRVVDDSIVILDNMNRKVHETGGQTRIGWISTAASEMLPAIVSSTATTVAVYLPIALIGGMISAAFSGFAWSVVISLVISLLVSVFVVPALYYLFWKGKPLAAGDPLAPFAMKIFPFVFQHKGKIAAGLLGLFLVAVIGAAILPVNFLPAMTKTGQLGIQVELPKTSTLAEVDAEVKRLEEVVKGNPKVGAFSLGLGSDFTPQSDDVFDTGGGWIQKPNIANLSLTVKKGTDIDSFAQDLQKQLNSLSTKAVYTVSNLSIAGDDSQLKINLTGSDSQTLESMAQSIRNQLKLIPGLAVEGTADTAEQQTQYRITLNRKAIEKYGIRLEEVLNRIQNYTAEGESAAFSLNQTLIPVVIHSDKQGSLKKDVFSQMAGETFLSQEGQKVMLDQLATLTPAGSSALEEKDGKPFAVVTATITSRDIGKVTKQVKNALRTLPLPEGVKVSLAGAPQQVYEMVSEMAISLFFSILLVIFIVSTVFRGWKAPLSVLICIPFAFIGSVFGMLIFGLEWNLAAFVGLLMLTGIVVTNGIVLVDKIERNLKVGIAVDEAVLQGTISRVRPILTTALTTVLTVLPLALSTRTDRFISQTLGIVVAGGLISSTLISLVMIPISYKWLYAKRTAPFFRKKTWPNQAASIGNGNVFD
ncbi:efflux RND transporter permease subunit [Neobacillus sp. SM06]|uniref:efflux RND transporter permease subunit n=1 Tax=Neobacillus sp. SM06 TaxID=3422492 RepID=UPI003D2D9589